MTYPCGAPISVAGKIHASACIVCRRLAYVSHPEWAAGAVAQRERAGHPVILTVRG